MDYILNGQGHGDVASRLMEHNFDVGALRPYRMPDGRTYITVNQNGRPTPLVTNTPSVMTKEAWIQLDTAVIKAARARLNIVADLRSAGLQFTIPNGMAKTVLQHQTQSDISAATVSMDGLREAERDRPQYDLVNLPLPITHKDFSFSAREVMASRNGGSPLDTTMAELAGRRVAEEVEKITLGVTTGIKYGGGQVYGYINYPYTLTKSLTAPSSSNHPTTVSEVLAMRKQSTDVNYFGPWVLYYSPAWYTYMDEDYDATYHNSGTLRERLMKIEGITAVKPADFLTGTSLVLAQMTPEVIRMVMGMDITTVQWETQGGMQLNYKVMCIMVPQMRADYNNQTGVVYGSV